MIRIVHLPALFNLRLLADSVPLGTPGAGTASFAGTVAIAGMFLGALLVAYWYRQRLLKAPKTDAGRAGDAAALAKDLNELTERLAEELDRKAERIEALIAAADERIRQMERLQMEAPVAAPALEARAIEPRHRVRHETLGVEPSHREVYDLADAGLSPVEIAQKLDRPTGQIELILNLRRGTVAI